MSYIHSREYADDGSIVSVQCSHPINVLVIDDNNFAKYRAGARCSHYGGFFTRFPANITVPEAGFWNVVLALPPDKKADIKYSINIIG